MRHLLSKGGRAALVRLAAGPSLLAFDFDGTLAPIARTPGSARMRSHTRRLLCAVAIAYPCAVISGRRRSEVADLVAGTRVQHVLGSHGIEPSRGAEAYARVARRALTALRDELQHEPGVWIEDKRFCLAVHYRAAPSHARARAAISAAVAELSPTVSAIPGKLVIDILPAAAPRKGNALQALLRTEGFRAALYVGDDETDEHVFRTRGHATLLTVRVGRARRSRAQYFLRGQREVDDLLAALHTLRTHRTKP